MAIVRRKCFISYHHVDQQAADKFVRDFDHEYNSFIARGLGEEMPGDVIDSTNPEYVMAKIRERYLADSTVTIVLMGRCTWARRYVDWEIQTSLRSGLYSTPNGLLGIKLPTFGGFPARLESNLPVGWPAKDGFARAISYPRSTNELVDNIEAAFSRRTTHQGLIVNPRDKMAHNRFCQ
jgi:MTH538 TIR-like domain (DUF1863)